MLPTTNTVPRIPHNDPRPIVVENARLQKRIRELETLLAHERGIAAIERRVADAARESARRAWSVAAVIGPRTRRPSADRPGEDLT